MRRNGRNGSAGRGRAVGVLVLTLLVWEVSARLGLMSPTLFPAPTTVGGAVVHGFTSGDLGRHLLATVSRAAAGVLLGGIPGLLVGLLIGWSRSARAVLEPYVAALHPLPKVALLPLFMILVGIGEPARILVIAMAAFFPLAINAMAGVREISPAHFEVARAYGARPWALVRRVVVPGSLPLVLAGLRLAANLALVMTVAVEMLQPDVGLGASVWLSWQILRVQDLYATLAVIAVLGIAVNGAMTLAASLLIPWRDSDLGEA